MYTLFRSVTDYIDELIYVYTLFRSVTDYLDALANRFEYSETLFCYPLGPIELREYCQALFEFKTIQFNHFKLVISQFSLQL